MRYLPLCGALAPLLLATGAEAAVITVVPDHLVKGTNQTLQVQVSGSEQVAGLDLSLQLGDGGTVFGGSDTAPVITAVDLLTGTIFATNNTGQQNPTTEPLVYAAAVTTGSGTVLANGLLATITLDTSAVPGDSFTLKLIGVKGLGGTTVDTVMFDNNAEPITLSIPSSITIAVPEPAMLLGLSALGGVLLLRPRDQRS